MGILDPEEDVGSMNKRPVWQQIIGESTSKSGQKQPIWSDGLPVYASIKPLSGRELVNAREIKPTISHTIKTRVFAGVKPTDRFVLGSGSTARYFNIEAVLDDNEVGQFYKIFATEIVG